MCKQYMTARLSFLSGRDIIFSSSQVSLSIHYYGNVCVLRESVPI